MSYFCPSTHAYGPHLLLPLLTLIAHLQFGFCSFHSLDLHTDLFLPKDILLNPFPIWYLWDNRQLTPWKWLCPLLCDTSFSGFFFCFPGHPFSIPLLTLSCITPLICCHVLGLNHPFAFFPFYTYFFLETHPFSRLPWPPFASNF